MNFYRIHFDCNIYLLDKVAETTEYKTTDTNQEDKQTQLFVTVLQRVCNGLNNNFIIKMFTLKEIQSCHKLNGIGYLQQTLVF